MNATERTPLPGGKALRREEAETAGELERSVERAEALLLTAIGSLSRERIDHAISGAASEVLRELSPHIEGALASLAQIEERRKLTEKELSYRRAFRILYETKG